MSDRSDAGAVVNILDTRILNRQPKTPYEKSKADLMDFTLRAAKIYAGTLRVNAVCPGPVLAPESVHELAGFTPVGRPAPEDVAQAVSFLLNAKSTTGCIVPVDGGQSLF
jgi:3alpha(or 20beta)-hydroxysteroid dehydrogenase